MGVSRFLSRRWSSIRCKWGQHRAVKRTKISKSRFEQTKPWLNLLYSNSRASKQATRTNTWSLRRLIELQMEPTLHLPPYHLQRRHKPQLLHILKRLPLINTNNLLLPSRTRSRGCQNLKRVRGRGRRIVRFVARTLNNFARNLPQLRQFKRCKITPIWRKQAKNMQFSHQKSKRE